MNSAISDILAEPLLFGWDPPRQQKAVLSIFVVLSLLAHVLCFYVFQIVYPTPVALLPPPARVIFVAPQSEGGRTLLRWIDAEDPALAFTTYLPPGARLAALPKADHVPSYSGVVPILKDIPAVKPDLRIPSSQPPGAVRISPRKMLSTAGGGRTYISFSSDLDQFGNPIVPRSQFVASTDETPETLRFRVAVNSFGEIRYCFPINSSGDAALDRQGRLQLLRSRFSQVNAKAAKRGSALVWGIATVQWGSDVVRPQQSPAATLTP
jgi:hypothetical protein